MWTPDKLKKHENTADYKRANEYYYKIGNIIKSCTTVPHILTCRRIIYNYQNYCLYLEINPQLVNTLIQNLKFYLKYKITKIRLS